MKSKHKPSWLSSILLFFNSLAAFGLLIIYLGAWINPSLFWFVALPGLTYPFLFLINLGFVVLWLVRGKRYFIVSLFTLAIGYNHITSFISFNNAQKPLPEYGVNIHLASYNVRVFDLYNYGPGWELNFTQRNNIFRYLEDKDFDIICFQEFVHDKSGAFKTLDTLPDILRAKYHTTGFTRNSKNINFFGLATFSAFPIINEGMIKFPTRAGNLCIYSDIKIGNDTIRVYNAHFESIGLGPEDYIFVENMTNVEQIADREFFRHGSIRILQRLKSAYAQRSVQVQLVRDHMSQSPYPTILAGDLNDTPTSFAYRILSKNMHDAFKSGRGLGRTYEWELPGFRIDYILHSTDFESFNFITEKRDYSDHYPISVKLNLK